MTEPSRPTKGTPYEPGAEHDPETESVDRFLNEARELVLSDRQGFLDVAAIAAMQGMLAAFPSDRSPSRAAPEITRDAWLLAELMLARREAVMQERDA